MWSSVMNSCWKILCLTEQGWLLFFYFVGSLILIFTLNTLMEILAQNISYDLSKFKIHFRALKMKEFK